MFHRALRRRSTRRAALVFAVIATSATTVRADQVRVGSENHVRARVLGLVEGRLRFSADDRSIRDVWIDEVAFMQVDREGAFVDFNEGERLLADRKFDEALQRFRRTLRATGDFWSELANARMAIAADGAQQVDVAVAALVRIMNRDMLGPPAAARLLPRNIPIGKGERSSKALGSVETAMTSVSGEAERTLLLVLRYDLLRAAGDVETASASSRLVRQAVPAPLATDRVFASVLTALRGAFPDSWDDAAMDSLDRAIAGCPEPQAAGFLLLKGRVLARSARGVEDRLRAAWPFLRVVAHFPRDAAAPEALLEAGELLRQAGERDGAAALASECAAHELATPDLRSRAEAMLSELRR